MDRPITKGELAEALSCFWNAAINGAHDRQDSTAFAVVGSMAEGISAVEQRLRELGADTAPKNAILDEIGFALESRGYAHMTNGKDIGALLDRLEKAEAGLERLKFLRELAGYVEDGSCETVSIGQDDATKEWIVRVGRRWWHASSFTGAIDAAKKEQR